MWYVLYMLCIHVLNINFVSVCERVLFDLTFILCASTGAVSSCVQCCFDIPGFL